MEGFRSLFYCRYYLERIKYNKIVFYVNNFFLIIKYTKKINIMNFTKGCLSLKITFL